jgi:hypothetical protein
MWIHLLSLGLIDGAGSQVIPPEVVGGHYYDWWRKKWEEQFKKPTIEEIEEFVEESPKEAIQALKTVAPQVAVGISPQLLQSQAGLIKSVANQLLIAIELKRISDAEEDDIEAILMMI